MFRMRIETINQGVKINSVFLKVRLYFKITFSLSFYTKSDSELHRIFNKGFQNHIIAHLK